MRDCFSVFAVARLHVAGDYAPHRARTGVASCVLRIKCSGNDGCKEQIDDPYVTHADNLTGNSAHSRRRGAHRYDGNLERLRFKAYSSDALPVRDQLIAKIEMNFQTRYTRPTALVTALLLLTGMSLVSTAASADPGPGQSETTSGAPSAAGALFNSHCSGCHGNIHGVTGRAPNLFSPRWQRTVTDQQIFQIVRHGVPNTEMAGFTTQQLSDEQISGLVAFIRAHKGNTRVYAPFVADPDGKVISSEKQKFKLQVIAKGLETPWALAFLPDGRLLITERPGRLRIYCNGKLSEPVKGLPTPHVEQDAGYLDITIHPRYRKNGWIYLAYSEAIANSAKGQEIGEPEGAGPDAQRRVASNTVIVRGKIDSHNQWTHQQVIFRSPATLRFAGNAHYGSRFLWDKQGHLFFTLGERGVMRNAQDLTNPLGKIHRINDDGSVPKDNPFVHTPGADPTIWSYGHRNPEGLAWDPVSGILWESEHGPQGGDEINIIKRGHNYGWGVISMGIQPGITEQVHEGMDQPVVYYTPTIAPSAISFYTGDRYPGWKNTSLFVCALAGQQLRRLEISGEKVTHQEVLFREFGRVRDIVQGPDGYFYIALQDPTGVNGLPVFASTPGKIVRVLPAS